MSCKNISEAVNTTRHVVTRWISRRSHIPQHEVDVSLTFYKSRPKGYNQDKQTYLKMCDDLDQALSRECQKRVTTPREWRDEHRTNVIAEFIGELADLVLKSPSQPQAPQVIAWLDN